MENEDFRTPGQLIQTLLDERDWTQQVLALVLGVHPSSIAKIISGRKRVDAKMALALNEVFETPAERFLSIQKSYDLAQARIVARPDPERATRAQLFGNLPVAEMMKRGWIDADDIRNFKQVEAALAKFFGVASADKIEILPHAAKKTEGSGPVTLTQQAWLHRVKQIADDMLVQKYSSKAVRAAIPKLQNLLLLEHEARHVPRILAESGIRFVIVESLSSAKIDGACFWLNDFAPVIGMSLRFDRIDNFWFVLRHELEHVLQGHGRDMAMLDAELDGDSAGTGLAVREEERVANQAAAQFCVPPEKLQKFIARKEPFFGEQDILGFARTLQLHPGLVAGQLQRYTGRYDRFRKHLVRIRSIVAPSAMVDGWGDVAPVDI